VLPHLHAYRQKVEHPGKWFFAKAVARGQRSGGSVLTRRPGANMNHQVSANGDSPSGGQVNPVETPSHDNFPGDIQWAFDLIPSNEAWMNVMFLLSRVYQV